MKPIKVLLTACGCPGASTLIRYLKNNGERKLEIVGTDMDPEAVGRFLTDSFYVVPEGSHEDYITTMLEVVKKETPDVLLSEGDPEIYPLACHRKEFQELGTIVMVSDPESIKNATNKFEMYETLRKNKFEPLPDYRSAQTIDEFLDALAELGYPDKPVVFKPHIGRGSRGVRILDESADRRTLLMEKKPVSKYMSLNEFQSIFREDEILPKFLLMEYLDGKEIATDIIAMEGRELLTIVKTVETARWGVIVRGELIENADLIEQTRNILKAIPLSYCLNFQFIADRLIEINARVSTFIYQEDLIAPYLAVKLAVGELSEEDIKLYSHKIDYGRRMVRYMDQVFHKKNVLLK
jgi:carbamoyl-phosphate synthase large subunit